MKAGAFFSASAWGALAIAAIGLATPTLAAEPQDGRRGDWTSRAENGGSRAENRGSWRQQRNDAAQARPQQAPVAAPRQAPRSAPPAVQNGRDRQVLFARERAQVEAQRSAEAQRQGTRTGRSDDQNRSGTWTRDSHRDNDRDRNDRGRDWNGDRNGSWNRGDHRWSGDQNDRRNGEWNRDRNGSWNRGDNRWSGERNRDYRRDDRRDHRQWDRHGWRSNDRYDWRRYREAHRSTYRIGRYYAPYYGYSYRRIGIGFTLGSLFYGNRYWIDDPWSYRLPAVYGPYRWVRYYDDVLLVDIYTGEVVDVIYDFFW